MAKRNAAIDFVRALAILLVVAGHLERGLVSARLVDGNGIVGVIDNLLYLYHVPVFFFLSGFLYKMEGRDDRQLLGGVLRYTVYPYFIWSIFYLLVRSNGSGFVNRTGAGLNFLDLFLHPPAPFWFLQTLALMQIVMIMTHRSLSRGFMLGMGLVAVVARFTVPGIAEPIANLMEFFVFYALGIYCQRWQPPRTPSLIVSLVFPACALLAVAVPVAYTSLAGRTLSLLLVCATFFLIRSATNQKASDTLQSSIITAIGSRTMSIFCMHVLFLVLVRAVLMKIGVTGLMPHAILGLLLGTAGPMIAANMIDRLNLSAVFGFKKLA